MKKRIACALWIKGVRQHGIVLDLSSKGLFVQTSAKPTPGDSVRIELTLPGQPRPTTLMATVARVRMVPPALLSVAQGGIGLLLQIFLRLSRALPDVRMIPQTHKQIGVP